MMVAMADERIDFKESKKKQKGARFDWSRRSSRQPKGRFQKREKNKKGKKNG